MAYLYQEIMNVPGLSGTWQNRNSQLYEKLGSPLGKYTGSYDQNIYLLNQLKKNNYYKSGLPGSKPAPSGGSGRSISSDYAAPGAETGENVSDTPTFESVMPYYDTWGQLEPTAREAAAQQVDPELNRNLRKGMREYLGQLASTGGGRFGRGIGGVGRLQAESARNRKAQLEDWVNTYRKGFDDIFYNPSEQAWTKGITSGKPGELPEIPTWNEFAAQYGQEMGTDAPIVQGNPGTRLASTVFQPEKRPFMNVLTPWTTPSYDSKPGAELKTPNDNAEFVTMSNSPSEMSIRTNWLNKYRDVVDPWARVDLVQELNDELRRFRGEQPAISGTTLPTTLGSLGSQYNLH